MDKWTKETAKKYQQDRRKHAIANGLCRRCCIRPHLLNRAMCTDCRDRHAKTARIQYSRDRNGYQRPPEFKGFCDICYESLPFADAALDHCHVSGKLRGWLCKGCNTGLGFFRDNLDALKRAVLYIRRHAPNPE